MNLAYYSFPCDNFTETYVREEDYRHLSEYCDYLVEFSKLPCLPKDLENLRAANASFAQENSQLKAELAEQKKFLTNCLAEKEDLKKGRNMAVDGYYDLLLKVGGLENKNSELLASNQNLALEVTELKEHIEKKSLTSRSPNEEYLSLLEAKIESLEKNHEHDIAGWKFKWNYACELAAIAQNKLDKIRQSL